MYNCPVHDGIFICDDNTNLRLMLLSRIVKEIWKRFVRKEYVEETIETTRHKFGSSVDSSLIASQAAVILEDPERSKIMKRYETELREIIKPKSIKLIFLPDLSGSMGEDERRAVQEACYAVSKSLYLFRIYSATRWR